MDVLCVPALAQLRPSGQRYCPGNDFAVYWSLLRQGASTAQQAGAHRRMGPARWQPPPNPKAATNRPHRGFCADAGQAGQMLPLWPPGLKKSATANIWRIFVIPRKFCPVSCFDSPQALSLRLFCFPYRKDRSIP